MELFDRDFIVSKIRVAIFVPLGTEKRVHSDRPGHGLACNVGHTSVYHFDGGPSLTCRAGQCIYLPQGSGYTVVSQPDTAVDTRDAGTYAINFHLLGDPVCQPMVLSVRGRDKVLSCFEKAETVWRKKSPGYQESCFSTLYQLVHLLRREEFSYSRLSDVLERLAPALQYIEANYTSENISMDHLARLCSVSQPYLRRLFHAAFSVSPAIYIRNLRLNYAKELLNTGEYSVTTAALLSGFNSADYFSREFKKHTGISPRRYLQSAE